MSTELSPDACGNVQSLRAMWSAKLKATEPPSIPSRLHSDQQQKEKLPKDKILIFNITNAAMTTAAINKESTAPSNNEKKVNFEPIETLPSIEEENSSEIPPPPPPVISNYQSQLAEILKHSVNKMNSGEIQKVFIKNTKKNGIHHWHTTRHVLRSGLIFHRSRRASDSILPLLIKTHTAHHRARTDSTDSTLGQSPFENLVNYLTHNDKNNKDDEDNCVMSLIVPQRMKRSASDTSDCIRRNKLDDSICQYQMIIRHLKNYDQFMSTRSAPSSHSTSSNDRGKSFDNKPIIETNVTKQNSRITNRQTQSLSRNIGRTFSQFIMNDPFLAPSVLRSSDEQQCVNISHASSQTDLSESIPDIKSETTDPIVSNVDIVRNDSVTNEEVKEVLNELDTMLENNDHEPPITPNSEINVIVINPPKLQEEPLPREIPLMQRLFEGKKTAYSPNDLKMKSIRLPEMMMKIYEIAKKKCFFDSEELVYTTKMIKVSRRGYKQHVRMLCITTERLYNLTKKDPYPKEGLLFSEILGITCTPCRDGFICVHTRESHEDRGDWLVIVEHPCEFITQLFTIMGRENNDDNFLKIETKFKHCRRFYGETSSNDCSIEVRKSDHFRIKVAEFDAIIIYTP